MRLVEITLGVLMYFGPFFGWIFFWAVLGPPLVRKVRSTLRHMNPNMLVIDADEVEPQTVRLVGVEYEIMPPKAYLALSMAMQGQQADEDPKKMADTIHRWIKAAFGKTEGPKVIKRLEAADDKLDLQHVMKLMGALAEQATGDPTT